MSDVIRLLPDSVANQIAAGGVCSLPASVVSGLVVEWGGGGGRPLGVVVAVAGTECIQVFAV